MKYLLLFSILLMSSCTDKTSIKIDLELYDELVSFKSRCQEEINQIRLEYEAIEQSNVAQLKEYEQAINNRKRQVGKLQKDIQKIINEQKLLELPDNSSLRQIAESINSKLDQLK